MDGCLRCCHGVKVKQAEENPLAFSQKEFRSAASSNGWISCGKLRKTAFPAEKSDHSTNGAATQGLVPQTAKAGLRISGVSSAAMGQ